MAADVAMVAGALGAAEVGARLGDGPSLGLGWSVGFAATALLLYAAAGLYLHRLQLDFTDDLRTIVVRTTLAAMAVLTAQVLVSDQADANALVRAWAFTCVYVTAGRVGLHWADVRDRRRGRGLRPTLIVGAGRVGRLLAQRLLARPELGLVPVGYLDKDPLADPEDELEVLGASWDLERVVAEHGIQQVVITFSRAPHEVLVRFVDRCAALGLDLALVPRLYEKTTRRMSVEHLGGLPLLTMRASNPDKDVYFAVKGVIDRVVAGLLLLLTLPLLAGAAAAVRLSVGSPVLFRQRRVGRDGREFEMLKLRTMRNPTAEQAPRIELPDGVAPGGVEGEDRRTRVGALLRRTAIDELPQLLNVLRGEMSLVGPRPERPEYARWFNETVYRYGDRHRVKSGITGWAQVHGLRGKTSVSDRAEWDNYYIDNCAFWLDLKILMMTPLAVVSLFRSVE